MYTDIRGNLTSKQKSIYLILGIILILGIWTLLSISKFLPNSILPTPKQVILSFNELHFKDGLVRNAFTSIYLNFLGYIEALAIAIPLGFAIGLIPVVRGILNKPIDTLRFIPLTAVTGLFIAWFGIGNPMKVHFLAFGILVYLLPVIVQRIDEVEDVYLKTVYTLGASNWQTIKTVYIPSVLSKLSDDVRVLVAISWTYIIIAEMLNSTGGLGSLIFKVGQRQGRIDKVFAILIIIILIGFLQDRLFMLLDKVLFPHKHRTSK
jgi:NitT/TauT family transport system permease protein